jgi:uncharacterized membrane protein
MMSNQITMLVYLALATGLLSLVGSSLILLAIYQTRSTAHPNNGRRNSIYRLKAHTSRVYRRILVLMSVYDIVYTLFSTVLGFVFNPQAFTTYDGHGTRFTCTLQGFFIQWGYGAYAYGGWLSVYYVLTIRYNLREAFLATYLEPVIHSSVFIFSLERHSLLQILD